MSTAVARPARNVLPRAWPWPLLLALTAAPAALLFVVDDTHPLVLLGGCIATVMLLAIPLAGLGGPWARTATTLILFAFAVAAVAVWRILGLVDVPPPSGRAVGALLAGPWAWWAYTVARMPHRTGRTTQPKKTPGVADQAYLSSLPVAKIVGERRRWKLPFAGSHVLVVGATGSGKGSVIWSTMKALAPHIHSGHVRVTGIDPKGGMELGVGEPLFADWEYGEGADWQERACETLEGHVTQMQSRAGRMRRNGLRKHRATVEEPLQVIVIDELLALTAMVSNAALRRRIKDALLLLLSQGRAPGWVVMAATQEPSKELLDTVRGFFPTRVCLRVVDWRHVDMALGQGARERGASSDKIAPDTPGRGFVYDETSGAVVQIQMDWVSDDDIRKLSVKYPAARFPGGAESARPAPLPPVSAAVNGRVLTDASAFPDGAGGAPALVRRVGDVWPGGRANIHVQCLADLLGVDKDDLMAELEESGAPVESVSARPVAGGAPTGKAGLRRTRYMEWSESCFRRSEGGA